MMEAMLEVQHILHDTSSEVFVPCDECDNIETLVDLFLVEYQKLAYAADMNSKWLWNNPSKFHVLWHWARKVRFIHPRRTNCYLDEDFVGRMKVLAQACASGSNTEQVLYNRFIKRKWAMHVMGRYCTL